MASKRQLLSELLYWVILMPLAEIGSGILGLLLIPVVIGKMLLDSIRSADPIESYLRGRIRRLTKEAMNQKWRKLRTKTEGYEFINRDSSRK